ncbi:hypothetical protein SV7mr_36880 [Stieleria bergensis]|uniref:IRE (Iron responsive element) n=1 Tax=Stieleria bergensis TaxID=2528025 RepID=A0A517SYE6_9BACT|nr:hypothetical protein SV7mr_36880 [Planctomycetes bacterium SV_7m_r]
MNQSAQLKRKLIYIAIILACIIPLYLLGRPTGGGDDAGGQLAQMRNAYEFSEANLGEISPASSTMKLATVGMRGVAATLLWQKAHEYKVKHEWDRLRAALNNISLLQPRYDKVWEHQAHNLAYNVSVQFDDYRQRYEMVREGTEYLERGVRLNRKAPRLIWYTGWFYGHKIGTSDEKKEFRVLFADDTEQHTRLANQGLPIFDARAEGPNNKPDNWLVSNLWLEKGAAMVDAGVKLRRITAINFFETGPKAIFKFAEAIEKEGTYNEKTQDAWVRAADGWAEFGRRSLPTTSNITVRLGALEDRLEEHGRVFDRFKVLCGPLYTEREKELVGTLTGTYLDVYQKDPKDRSKAEQRLMPEIKRLIRPDVKLLLAELPADKRLKGIELIDNMIQLEDRIRRIEGYREQINYSYWESLAMAEQEERTIEARRLIYEAKKFADNAQLKESLEKYEEAFELWAEIFDDYPILTIDDSADDLYESVRQYMIALDSNDLPEGFPLETFVELMAEESYARVEMYEEVRETQKEKAAQRRRELEEEERKRDAADAEQAKADAEKAAEMKAAEGNQDTSRDVAAEKAEAEDKPADAQATEDKDNAAEKADEEPVAEGDKISEGQAVKEEAAAEKQGANEAGSDETPEQPTSDGNPAGEAAAENQPPPPAESN